ncbi:MAG: hypothetical protein P1V97_02040 [Planctomycetota bacterium]|nr:hypothetical protein [Planctomycetota bacterium]
MILEGLEKTVVALTVGLILIAALAVAGLTVVPLQSGISKTVIDSELALIRFMDAENAKNGKGQPRVIRFADGPVPDRNPRVSAKNPRIRGKTKAGKGPTGSSKRSYLEPKSKEKVAYSNDYYSGGEPFPDEERVRGIPWLKREYNVTYYRPQQVPSSLIQYYQSLEAATQLIKEPKGRFEEGVNGTSFTVTAIPKTSYLNTVVGLQPGDKILSVNGNKIAGVGFAAAKSIYEQVKGASKFAVKIERKGRVQVLSFTVKKR